MAGEAAKLPAAEPLGTCYTQSTGQMDNWSGPFSLPLNSCAALAGEQTDLSQDGTSWAHWQDYQQDYQIVAHREGYFELYVNQKAVGRRYWSVDKLVQDVTADIDGFWHREFDSHGWDYKSPDNVQGYTRRIRTACGPAVLNNAFYCVRSHSIYFDMNLLGQQFKTAGDFAPVTVIAHEWGHHIQAQIEQHLRYNVDVELQADCFAGAYARDAEARGMLEDGDAEEGASFLSKVGDRRKLSAKDPRAHGTPTQRAAAYEQGYKDGVDGCLK
jgi:predicted metalloprotease